MQVMQILQNVIFVYNLRCLLWTILSVILRNTAFLCFSVHLENRRFRGMFWQVLYEE